MILIARKNLFSSFFSNPNFSFLCNSISHLRRRLITTHSPLIYDVLFLKHQFSSEFASSIASAHLTKSTTPKRADSVLSLLKDNSFTNAQLEKIIRYNAGILGYNVEGLQLKLSVFRDLGLSSEEIAKMMVGNANILHLSVPNKIIPKLSILKGLLGSDQAVARLLRKSAWFLNSSGFNNTLLPNIEIMKGSGIPTERVLHFLFVSPRTFLIKPDVIRKSVDKTVEFGVTRNSTNFMVAVKIFSYMSQEMLEAKLQFSRDLGFSDAEVLIMIRRQPNILSISQKKLKNVVDLLVGTGKYNTSNIVTDPSSFGRSIEKRLEPRLQILGILESRNLIEKWPCLSTVSAFTDARFYDRFVSPYTEEVGESFNNISYLNGKMNKTRDACSRTVTKSVSLGFNGSLFSCGTNACQVGMASVLGTLPRQQAKKAIPVHFDEVGIVGIALTLYFSWWMSVSGMFIYTVCGWGPNCPDTQSKLAYDHMSLLQNPGLDFSQAQFNGNCPDPRTFMGGIRSD